MISTRTPLPEPFILLPEVAHALQVGTPVVALESCVITHGLPQPQNLILAQQMEAEVRAGGAVPATIGVLFGKVHIGLDEGQISTLASNHKARKISVRDLAPAVAQKASGGTTVASTLFCAQQAGIKVFATGGIGGVHRDTPDDISNDLVQLSRCPLVVVCAGAKAILDLPATLEMLETLAVPVIGYQTSEFPAFFSRESGLPLPARADSAAELAAIASAHWSLGFKSALLLAVPPPSETALPREKIEKMIQQASAEAVQKQIHGPEVTPFLLARVNELSGGDSLKVNLDLLKNNARIAAQVAGYIYQPAGTGLF